MKYHVSFRTIEAVGARHYTWFVFNDAGVTLARDFPSKSHALVWALRELGFSA